MTRLNSLHVQELNQQEVDRLASTYGSVERLLSCPADYEELLPLLDSENEPQADHPVPNLGQQQQAHMVAVLRQVCSDFAPQVSSGTEMLARLSSDVSLLPTGCYSVDVLLRGGVREGYLVELAGETASGKTQLCHMVAANTAGMGLRVVYIDTTNSFSAARTQQLIRQMPSVVQAAGRMTDDQLMSAISVVRLHGAHALLSSLDQLLVSLSQMQVSPGHVRPAAAPALLVIDSVSAVLSPVLGGQQHHQGQTLVVCLGRLLKQLADRFNIAVLVTNHVVSAGSSADAGYKPALGELWRAQAHVRLQLSRGQGDLRHVALTSSSMDVCPQYAAFNVSAPAALPPAPT